MEWMADNTDFEKINIYENRIKELENILKIKQDIIEGERKRIAEIIEDMFKPEARNSYDEGFNEALRAIHDQIMF